MFLLSDHGIPKDVESKRILSPIQAIYDRQPHDSRLRIVIRGAHHFTFSDDGARLKSAAFRGVLRVLAGLRIDGRRQVEVTAFAVRTFFDEHLKGAKDTTSPFPIFTVSAPTGAFHVRVRAITASERSGPSNEIQIFVNTATPPSAPNLLALVNGTSLALTWRPTFLGGAATAHVLDVAGSMNVSVPLSEATSVTFGGVPGGTYTLSVSASNASGTSAASDAVTVTVPGPCSGAPLAPAGFLAYRVGNTIYVVWDPPASGPAPTQYVLTVSGAFNASFPTTARALSGVVGPGSYGLSVAASNACGTSAATAVQIVTVP
jgi:hypothetical protein